MFDWSTLAKMKTKNEPKLASELIYESLFPRKHGKKNLLLKDPSHVDLSHLKHEQVISLRLWLAEPTETETEAIPKKLTEPLKVCTATPAARSLLCQLL